MFPSVLSFELVLVVSAPQEVEFLTSSIGQLKVVQTKYVEAKDSLNVLNKSNEGELVVTRLLLVVHNLVSRFPSLVFLEMSCNGPVGLT